MYEGRLTLMSGILKSQKNYKQEEEKEEEGITKNRENVLNISFSFKSELNYLHNATTNTLIPGQ